MPASQPSPDSPLRKLAPSGGWIGTEPTEYVVRARDAEEALTLTVYCHYVLLGRIAAKYAGRVAHSLAELSELPGLRTFDVLIGLKPGPGRNTRWLSSEILEIGEAA